MAALAQLLRALTLCFALVIGAALALAAPTAPAAFCGLPAGAPGPQDQALRNFARDMGLHQIDAFVSVANHLHRTGRLPDCYLTKRAARAKGWHPGRDLWQVAPGAAIGGDAFGNHEARLPTRFGSRYREADLDYGGGRRGSARLIYVENGAGTWRQWVTVDHYRRFFKLPEPE